VRATLPWKLPPVLLRDLVAFAVSRINIKRSSAVNSNVCARVRFTSVKPDYRKELSLGFSDYCEVYDGTDNTMKSRTVPCIALYPCSNYTGSWAFYNLLTKTRIRRTQWKKMVTTQDFGERMNALNPEAVILEPVGGNKDEVVKDSVGNRDGDNDIPSETPDEQPSTNLPDMEMVDEDVPDLVDQDEEESDEEADDESVSDDSKSEKSSRPLRRSTRILEGVKKPARFRQITHTVKVRDDEEGAKEGIKRTQEEEIKLVFNDLKAVELVMKKDIPEGFKAHNTHLFTVEKFRADGRHE
jgi:hypothetical protein